MREKVVVMLTALGVAGAADDPLLDMVLTNVQWRIKNLSNLSEIPEGLESLAVSMAVGEYLNMKKCSRQLEGFDLDAAVKSTGSDGALTSTTPRAGLPASFGVSVLRSN